MSSVFRPCYTAAVRLVNVAWSHDAQAYPGQRLGLPEEGTGSVAGWGRRILALCADWAVSLLVVAAFIGGEVWSGGGATAFAPLLALFVQMTVLTGLLGASIGQRVLGMAVVRLDRHPVGLPRAAVRSLLICLAIPPLVFDRDSRGLHDLAAGTVVVRR